MLPVRAVSLERIEESFTGFVAGAQVGAQRLLIETTLVRTGVGHPHHLVVDLGSLVQEPVSLDSRRRRVSIGESISEGSRVTLKEVFWWLRLSTF